MNDSEIEHQCRATFAEVLELDLEEVGLDDDFFKDLGGDSLQKLDLVVAMGQQFQTEFSDAEAPQFDTVRSASLAVARRLQLQ